ncbi:LysM peptidoglycan-binding domain-containing protein [Modestobacter lacusdianchii]
MVSPQRSLTASTPASSRPGPVRPASARPAPARAVGVRGAQSVAPAVARRDPARPGGRPVRVDGVAAARPVRGGCGRDGSATGRVAGEWPPYDLGPAPLRLTDRGRRVAAGLSVAIGLSIAAATVVVVELGDRDGGLRLAGSSTVVVQSGDTLWSIAREVAPEEDPRAVVDAIVELNGLDSVDLLPGAELELP